MSTSGPKLEPEPDDREELGDDDAHTMVGGRGSYMCALFGQRGSWTCDLALNMVDNNSPVSSTVAKIKNVSADSRKSADKIHVVIILSDSQTTLAVSGKKQPPVDFFITQANDVGF